ncbi:MAG: glycosyltransferase family 2 protein [Patescibacteria group bacterium]|nr:glycosyltransferase family 2 protein [Patescibacteria group bacterium]
MDLSIIILNYKSKGLVKQCLKALRLNPPTVSHEIIVVDNDSRDGVGEMLVRDFPEVRFIQTGKNRGYAAGNNIGLGASNGRLLLILNPDISVRAGSVDELVEFMDANPKIGIAGPKLVKATGEVDQSCYRYPTCLVPLYRRTPLGRTAFGRRALGEYLMADYDRRDVRGVDWLLGAVLLVRREAFEQIGPLDEQFPLYFEDTDWCRRFWEAGWQVTYFPGSEMVHLHDRLSAQDRWYSALFMNQAARWHVISFLKYLWKWRESKPRG